MSFVLRFLCLSGRRPFPNSSRGLQGIKTIHFMGTLWPDNDGRFIGFGQPMLQDGQNELILTSSMFMFRANLSLKLLFVDNRLMEISGYSHQKLLENTLYKFVFPNDLSQVTEMHQIALNQGHSQSKYFRLLNIKGGNFWINCNLYLINFGRLNINFEPQFLIGVCYIVSGLEDCDNCENKRENKNNKNI
uniref:PAS domain-containing protein n=2 Tax=Meloidogyne TaxID=189290 RepID=A0A6V7XE29_MELEN|nr:unnamed protein product [Meloidogyne enterolobii]